MHKDPKIEPEAYSKEEKKYLDYLIKKHGKRINIKDKK